MNNKGLCFRCESRAKFLEEGIRIRFECGVVESSVCGCYMFKPVKPIAIQKREVDKRPLSLNILSARVERVDTEQELELTLKTTTDNKTLIYWKPKE